MIRFNAKGAMVVATALAALQRRRAGRRHFRCGCHLPLSDLFEVGRCLQDADRRRPELSVDRLRRRHQADQGQDRHLRRLGHAAEARRTAGRRAGAVPHDHRRCRAGREHQGRDGRVSWCSTAPTIAAIYMGEITKWNDARIKKLNPKLTLPATNIAPVYRSDGSGTNFLFSDYLSKVSPKFQSSSAALRPRCNGRWASAPRATRAWPT